MLKQNLKKILATLYYLSGRVDRKIFDLSQSGRLVLTYHRVLNNKHDVEGLQEGMFVDLSTFENHLCFLKDKFNIRPLRELLKQNRGFDCPEGKPEVFITFDDGWIDFYQNIYPLLLKHSTPVTVFLPTKFIGTDCLFWTDRLFQILKKIPQNTNCLRRNVSALSTRIVGLQVITKGHDIFEEAISIYKGYTMNDIEDSLCELESVFEVKRGNVGRSFVDFKEVEEMKMSGLVSFGSHTVDHCILTNETDESVVSQLKESYDVLIDKNVASTDFLPFCYPNGDYNAFIAKQVKSQGYSLALSTDKGWHAAHDSPYTIKRISVHQDISSSKSLFACRLAGVF